MAIDPPEIEKISPEDAEKLFEAAGSPSIVDLIGCGDRAPDSGSRIIGGFELEATEFELGEPFDPEADDDDDDSAFNPWADGPWA